MDKDTGKTNGANGEAKTAHADSNGATPANGQVNMITDDNFIAEVLDIGAPVLVDFMAQWCGPCKFMGPVFAELAPDYTGKVKFAKLDVDESPGVASALQIQSIPTFMLFSGRTVYAAGVGAMKPNDLRQWIEEGLARIEAQPVSAE
jgi:thioredoxin 1